MTGRRRATLSGERYWRTEARHLSRIIALGTWLDAWLPWQAGLTVAAALVLIATRRTAAGTPWLWLVWLGLLAASAALALWRTRPRFESPAAALVRLEAELRLHTRLSAAAAGVAEWPEPRETRGYRLRWQRLRVGPPVAAPAALLLAAALVPIAPRPAPAAPPAPPMAWQSVEEWLARLDEEQLVDEESLEEWRERVEELRATPPETWYDHAALEAGDALEARLGAAVRGLGEGLESAARGVGSLDAGAPDESVLDALRETLAGLEAGELVLDGELAEALRRASGDGLKELSRADVDELERRLAEGAAACRNARPCPPGATDCVPGRGWGAAPSRGPGEAPLAWTDAAPLGLEPEAEALAAGDDVRRAALGELISTTREARRVDEGDFEGGLTSGAAAGGEGGDAVWRDALTPREREVLRRYFR